jgi:hypothetical protein
MAFYVALAVAHPKPEIKTLKLAQPILRSTSLLEVGAVGLLTLAGAGIWMLVIPLELVGVPGA